MEQPWTRELLSYDPSSLNYSVVEAVQQGSTTSNSWNILQWSLFRQLLGSSSSLAMLNILKLVKTILPSLFLQLLRSSSSWTRLNYPELMKTSHTRIVHSITQWMKQLNRVELSRSNENASYKNRSFNISGWSSWTGLNYPKLIKYCPMIIVLSITQ